MELSHSRHTGVKGRGGGRSGDSLVAAQQLCEGRLDDRTVRRAQSIDSQRKLCHAATACHSLQSPDDTGSKTSDTQHLLGK